MSTKRFYLAKYLRAFASKYEAASTVTKIISMKVHILLSVMLIATTSCFAGEYAGIATGLYERAKKAPNPGEAC